MPDYFNSKDNKEPDYKASEAITNRRHNEFKNIFSGIECFEGTFYLQVKEGNHPYQAPLRKSSLCAAKAIERRARMITEAANYCCVLTKVVQQFHVGTQS